MRIVCHLHNNWPHECEQTKASECRRERGEEGIRKRGMSAVVAAAKRANNLYFAIDGNGSDHQQPRVIGR